ncbi:MAG: 3-dehydroquinate dehydratase [Candidatus Marinimicrobia bacterium]|nr:3-dehydroquinate dehydratase [Candidatus Neomarinimicrobiota bacterium]|tara:strand:+ start:28992 stop:29417 length:426 start_codon:yes stop_codon:yes gene_type:complete
MNILVINGPNLNLLGTRETKIYGHESLDEIMTWLENSIEGLNHNFKFYQSNSEGDLINIMQDERQWAKGILINAGALSHYSYAIADTITSIKVPAIEIHLSDTDNREEFRKKSVLKDVCIKTIKGLGKHSYLEGLKYLENI